MPFDDPYFPIEFDVGTAGGPHIHMDSSGLYITDGVGDNIELIPQTTNNVPEIDFTFARDIGVAKSAKVWATPSNDGNGTYLHMQANLKAGVVGQQALLNLFTQTTSGPSFAELRSSEVLLTSDPSGNAVTWDGVTETVQGIVSAQQLQESPGVAWTPYTPGYVNFTLGNGTVDASYRKLGKTCEVSISITAGSTTTNSGTVTAPASVSLPFTAKRAEALAGFTRVSGGQVCTACAGILAGTAQALMIAGTQSLTNTYPFGLTAGQQFVFTGSYETT